MFAMAHSTENKSVATFHNKHLELVHAFSIHIDAIWLLPEALNQVCEFSPSSATSGNCRADIDILFGQISVAATTYVVKHTCVLCPDIDFWS